MSLRVLNPNAEVLNKSAALHMNINAAKGLQDVLKSNLGPKGTIKMLVRGAGDIKLTKDGNTLLKEMNISLNSFTARMASLVSRRTPLGDLSNSMKAVASRIPHDASKMKSISKAPGKWQTAGRKPLSDISNSRKPETKKQSFNAKKLAVLTEESDQTSAIAGEKCLNNHQECVKAQTRAMDINEFLQSIGLKDDFSKQLAAPCSPLASITKMKSPPRPLQLEAKVEQPPKDQSWEFNLDSPSPFRTPISQMNYRDWKDLDWCISFKLIETPELPKH